MTTLTRKPRVLITGLTMPASKLLSPGMDTTAFSTKMEASISHAVSLPQFEVHRFDMDHSVPASSPESIDAFAKMVRSQHYDAHIIGAGLRKIPTLVGLLERILNEVIAAAEGKGGTRVLFSGDGADHGGCLERGFPELFENKV